jgi:hypothetical protein
VVSSPLLLAAPVSHIRYRRSGKSGHPWFYFCVVLNNSNNSCLKYTSLTQSVVDATGNLGGGEPDLPNRALSGRTTQGPSAEGFQKCAPLDSPHASLSVYKSSTAKLILTKFDVVEFHCNLSVQCNINAD